MAIGAQKSLFSNKNILSMMRDNMDYEFYPQNTHFQKSRKPNKLDTTLLLAQNCYRLVELPNEVLHDPISKKRRKVCTYTGPVLTA